MNQPIRTLEGFEWDPSKRLENLERHGVDFGAVAPALARDGWSYRLDTKHSQVEDRFNTFVQLEGRPLLHVTYTVRGRKIRLISVRAAKKREREGFEAGTLEGQWAMVNW